MDERKMDNAEFDRMYNDPGPFIYQDDGFVITLDHQEHVVKWQCIVGMVGFKQDLYTVDTIGLDVFCEDQLRFSLCEETPGWFQFLLRTKAVFGQIPQQWKIEIALPAFAPKPTLIYDRAGRTLSEFIKAEYPEPDPFSLMKLVKQIMKVGW